MQAVPPLHERKIFSIANAITLIITRLEPATATPFGTCIININTSKLLEHKIRTEIKQGDYYENMIQAVLMTWM